MPIACALHWYESLLFLAPVAIVMVVLWVTSKIEKRREEQESGSPQGGALGMSG
jgi:cyanate permease